MAAVLKVSPRTLMRHWRANGLKPHLVPGFKISRGPKFIEKLEDIVGRYMFPPGHALVLCCDERSQVQALHRTQPGLPLKKERAQTMAHDDKCRGTATLFAAPKVLDGKVISQSQQRHAHAAWLKFLRKKRPRYAQGQDAAFDCRQQRNPQASRPARWAGQAPARQPALHADTVPPGWAWWSASSVTSPPSGCVAASSPACQNWRRRSTNTSPFTTPTQRRAFGPRARGTSFRRSLAPTPG